jgi:hypothetical protein
MYGNPYNVFNSQPSVDRINAQINELENMKKQIQQPIQQPTNLTQNFQITPNNSSTIKYANSMDEVERNMVLGETPFFSNDMSVVWIKNPKGEIKTYELNEIVKKDEKDLMIESLQIQLNEMKGMIENAKSNGDDVSKSIESTKSPSISNGKSGNTKQK